MKRLVLKSKRAVSKTDMEDDAEKIVLLLTAILPGGVYDKVNEYLKEYKETYGYIRGKPSSVQRFKDLIKNDE